MKEIRTKYADKPAELKRSEELMHTVLDEMERRKALPSVAIVDDKTLDKRSTAERAQQMGREQNKDRDIQR